MSGKVGNKQTLYNDEGGVSPVIGTILMVAVTVMLSAGVYVWTTVFSEDTAAPESASLRLTGVDRDGDGLVEWIRVTLVSGTDAPYHQDVVGLQVLPPSATMLNDTSLCTTPSTDGTVAGCQTNATGVWNIGDSLFIPCQEDGKHLVTMTIRGHTVLDNSIQCNEAAT